jgi:eukaryotic-like serine/threonine-protein kinase
MQTPSDLIGKTLSTKYRVIERLGGGGTGEVFKAENVKLQQLVAIKLLKASPQDSDAAGIPARFEQEARAAAELSHRNIISVTDFGFLGDGSPYVVMDYFPGTSLADTISRNGPLAPDQAVVLFIQICDGLIHAHSKSILHRDIKPSNIMLIEEDGGHEAKLIDFGGSQSLNVLDRASGADLVGSPFYMSPEQCQGQILDERSDIFSLGCTMFEALTGKPPFLGENVMSTIYKRMNEKAPRLSDAAPTREFPSALEKIVARSLEQNHERRYQTAAHLKQDLLALQQGDLPRWPWRLNGGQFFHSRKRMAVAALSILLLAFAIMGALSIKYAQDHSKPFEGSP